MEETKILSSIKTEDKVDESFFGSSRQKCGEIFMYMKNNLVFICTFCDSKFHKIEEFVEHLEQHLHCFPDNDVKDDPLEFNDSKPIVSESFQSTSELCTSSKGKMEMCDSSETAIVTKNTVENQSLASPNSENNHLKLSSTLPEQRGKVNVDESVLELQPKDNQKKGRSPDLFCDSCNKFFKTKSGIRKHKLSCEAPPEFPQTVEIRQSEEIMNNDGNKINSDSDGASSVFADPIVDQCQCRYCGRRFKHRANRIQHEQIHTGEKKYKCELCEKSFRTTHLYNNHLMTHKKIRPHKCHLCDQAFSCSVNLTVHIRRHTGEKPYKCQYCDMCFVVSTEKKHHERQHTGEKPHQCNECGQCFATGSRLQTHLTKHKGDKKFKCKDCDKSYFTAAELKVHALRHTDERFTCNMCGSKFLRKEYLKKHMVLHSDIKPHMCSICGKRFHQRTGLLIHRKTHTLKGI